MHRTRVRIRWGRVGSLIAIAATAMALAGGSPGASPELKPVSGRTVTVRAGDTVWSIAARIAGPTRDPRPLVDAIVTQNGIDPGAIPGV